MCWTKHRGAPQLGEANTWQSTKGINVLPFAGVALHSPDALCRHKPGPFQRMRIKTQSHADPGRLCAICWAFRSARRCCPWKTGNSPTSSTATTWSSSSQLPTIPRRHCLFIPVSQAIAQQISANAVGLQQHRRSLHQPRVGGSGGCRGETSAVGPARWWPRLRNR